MQRFSSIGGRNVDFGFASAAGRLDSYIATKHPADAESIDGAKGIQLAAMKLDAMPCRFPVERVGINNRAGCVVHPKKVMRLQLADEDSDLFRRKTHRFANFRKPRRPAAAA